MNTPILLAIGSKVRFVILFMTDRQISTTDGWDTMEDAGMVVTDIRVLSKREKAHQDYTVIENTHDGKKANFPEGRFGFTTRYICYTKKSPSPNGGFVVVTELKVLPIGDKSPLGLLPLLHTMDDNTTSFSSKQLMVKFVALEEATEAILDIIILSSQKKEEVPLNYKRLPEINGFSICYKVGPVPKKKTSKGPLSTSSLPATTNQLQGGQKDGGVAKPKKAIDGVTFELAKEKADLLRQFSLDQSFQMLSLQDIENKYNFDFSRYRSLAA